MIQRIDIQHWASAEAVLKLQKASYAVEAELIGTDEIPPLKDTIETLQHCGETFYGYFLEDELCGVIAIEMQETILTIARLIVHPKFFRQGIAQKLLHFIEENLPVEKLVVSTGTKNVPAVNFYMKNGFQKVKDVIINEQLSLSFFEK